MKTCSVCAGDGWTMVDNKAGICPRCLELARGLKNKLYLERVKELANILKRRMK